MMSFKFSTILYPTQQWVIRNIINDENMTTNGLVDMAVNFDEVNFKTFAE